MGIISNDLRIKDVRIMDNFFWKVLEGIIGKTLSILGSGISSGEFIGQ